MAEATGTIKKIDKTSIITMLPMPRKSPTHVTSPTKGRVSVSPVAQVTKAKTAAQAATKRAIVRPRPRKSTLRNRGSSICPKARKNAVKIMRPSMW